MTPEERFERIEKTLDRIDEDLEILARHVVNHQERLGLLEVRLGVLTESLIALTESQKKTDEVLRETGDHLNALIGVVERYFSNGRK